MGETNDLGTYHVRVEFEDGRGYIQTWRTGPRYSHGRNDIHPLHATRIMPTWESEADLLRGIWYMYVHGNWSCDCNKRLFLADAAQESEPVDDACGDTLTIKGNAVTVIRPDGSEIRLALDEEYDGQLQ